VSSRVQRGNMSECKASVVNESETFLHCSLVGCATRGYGVYTMKICTDPFNAQRRAVVDQCHRLNAENPQSREGKKARLIPHIFPESSRSYRPILDVHLTIYR